MAFFEYTASDQNGNIKKGEIEAVDQKVVIDYLKSDNLLVVNIKEKSSALGQKISFGGKIGYLEKINFCGNLSTMIKAGVNLTQALDVIGQESKNSHFQRILNDLKFSVENGRPLSEALSHYKKDFDPVFISMIKAGEASGKLDEALFRLNIQLKKEYSLISKVKNALIYPMVLIAGVLGVLILIITFVIPRLATVFSGSNLKIPFTTRVMFFLSKVMSYQPILTFAVIVIIVICLVMIFRTKTARTGLRRLFFRLPVSKNLLKEIELVRFCRTMGGLLGSGLSIGEVLNITASGASLPVYKKIILESKEKIIKGVSLTNAFKGMDDYFPPLLVSVITVGEKTGQLDKLLISLADFYEEQADNTLKTLSSLVEPVLLVIVGLLIGGMAISIVVPIYQLIGTI